MEFVVSKLSSEGQVGVAGLQCRLHVLLEVATHLYYLAQVIFRDLWRFVASLLGFKRCKCDGCLERWSLLAAKRHTKTPKRVLTVANFAPVPLKVLQLRRGSNKLLGLVRVVDPGSCDLMVCGQLLEGILPNLLAGGIVERLVAKLNMDSRHEGFVKGADAVRRQEHYALKVVQGSEENYRGYQHV